GRKSQLLAAVFIAYALLSFIVPVWVRGSNFDRVVEGRDYQYRFSVIPLMMLSSAIAVLVAPVRSASTRAFRRFAAPLFVAYVIILTWSGFFVTNLRSSGPRWSSALVHAYVRECLGAPDDKRLWIKNKGW